MVSGSNKRRNAAGGFDSFTFAPRSTTAQPNGCWVEATIHMLKYWLFAP